jgi:hypothetical protein
VCHSIHWYRQTALRWLFPWQMVGMFDRVFDRGHPKTVSQKVVKWGKPRRGRGSRGWACLDLNQGPHPYQGCANIGQMSLFATVHHSESR